MAGMKRFVTYIYSYEDKKKGNNVGFARVDIRGEECRIERHLRGIYPGRCNCKIFLIKEEEESLVGVPVGELKIMNGNGDFGTAVKAEQIGESPFGIQEMEGVFLLGEDERIFMSRWQEGRISGIDRACFREWKPETKQAPPENVRSAVRPNLSGVQSRGARFGPVGMQNSGTRINAASMQTGTAGTQPEPAEQQPVNTRPDTGEVQSNQRSIRNLNMETAPVSGTQPDSTGMRSGNTSIPQDENENLTATEIPMRNIFPEYNWLAVWENLQKSHPVCTPFEDSDIVCVRIELKDLRDLPKRYWYLGNNSFLLHGFFNYQHLIIGKLKEDRWFIGIPGIYQRQERVMAAIFGFSEFVPAAVEEPRDDDGEPINRYGYWYRYIEE